ncbi:Translation elongation factor [Dermatophagoides pteronyssinus]|uniref:Translation elongation factor n=1 Tax=Dermatophagoides pteronyssinus TaxID=6956 RepID=A0ABQ8JW05_DERPT|nr:Translation elongation factor [Dermatophagoides pteronyssinus]
MSKLYSNEDNYRTYKALIASKYSGKSVSVIPTESGKSCPQKFFGHVPALETSNVNLFESNAIAYYLSNAQLRGGNDESLQSQVLQWVSFSSTDLWPAVFAWVLPATGCSNSKQTLEPAKNQVKNLLKMLNDYLLTRTYLVGERITLADICMAVTLLPLYRYVLEPSIRDQYGNVNRYFMTLINQKQFVDVIGKVELCTAVKQVSQKTEAKPKKEKKEPKKEKEVPVEDDAGDDLMPAMPKPKDPFEKFPKGKFDFDDFKRFYSNNPEVKSIPYFWEKFDKENYSIWYCEYKYPQELTKVFMSCNLISGMFQRLDRMRKNAFSSMILFGEDNNSTISGIWVWRGHELAFPLSEDWTIDYESYEWKKLNPDDEKTKLMVNEYFSWEGKFDGKKFNQGKIFK